MIETKPYFILDVILSQTDKTSFTNWTVDGGYQTGLSVSSNGSKVLTELLEMVM